MKSIIFTLLTLSFISAAGAATCQQNEKLVNFRTYSPSDKDILEAKRMRLLGAQGRLVFVMARDYHFDIDKYTPTEVLDYNGNVAAKFKKLDVKKINVSGYTLKAGTRLKVTGVSDTDRNISYFKEYASLYMVQTNLPLAGFYMTVHELALAQAPYIVCAPKI